MEEKKKRGRPKKSDATNVVTAQITEEKATHKKDTEMKKVEKKTPVKKVATKKTSAKNTDEQTKKTEEKAKRTVGRPKKNTSAKSKNATDAEKSEIMSVSSENIVNVEAEVTKKKSDNVKNTKRGQKETKVAKNVSSSKESIEDTEKQSVNFTLVEVEKEHTSKVKAKAKPKARGRKKVSSKEQLALTETKRLALTEAKTKALPKHDVSETLPVEQGAKDLALYEKGELALTENVVQTSHNQEQKTPTQAKKEHRPRKRGRKKKHKETADFVAGANGVAPYLGEESLGTAGEQAGLGVFGVIEEAPVPAEVLPLVDTEEKAPKKNRKRGRKKKAKAVESTLASDFENAPIVEDGDLARIEAEENVKAVENAKSSKSTKQNKKATKEEKIHRVLYVSTVPDEQVEVVITENGVVSEYFVEMAHQSKIRGNIYKGIINNVDTNLQAAFVNFGCGKNGFLQIDEVHPEYYLAPHDETQGKYPPIQKVLKVGQEVLVQVVKEPNGSKGAFLTTWLSLAGRFLVLIPGQEQIGVSRKVEDNEERQRLRALLSGIKPGENMGVIIRTASEGASKTNIQKDLQLLKRSWKNIQKQVQKLPTPSLVYQEADLSARAVRDYLKEDIHEVWVDSKEVEKSVAELVKVVFPKNTDMLHLHEDSRQTLWERFHIARQLEEVTKREVNLPSGGRLVFDQTEALMAIDINSGKSQGKTNFESMVYRTNMEAVEAIARHLRLRDIGGQVVIDFIEMRDKGHCREVEKALHNAMKRDRARHDIGKLSNFGLLELVRQRTGSSVISITSEPCPHCRGTGFRRNLEWQAQGILREIKSKLAGKNVPSTYVHHVDQEIAFYLLNKKRDRLSELEQEYDTRIEIHLK